MTIKINIGAVLIGMVLVSFIIFPVSADADPFESAGDPVTPGLPSSLPFELPDGVGTVGSDGSLHVNLANEPQNTLVAGNTQSFSPDQIVGSYQDTTMKKTTGVDGSLFEGGADIDYTVSHDNSVSGTVAYKFIEQGWTIKVKGTVSGEVSPDGTLTLTSDDAMVKYAGQTYPISMNVNAQYTGDQFEGTKVITAAGVTGTLDFTGQRIV